MAMIDWEDRTPRCQNSVVAYVERRKLKRSGSAVPAVISLLALAFQGWTAACLLMN